MKMTRKQLIEAYEKLAYAEGEYDAWDDEIEPKLKYMATEKIAKWYEEDKQYWKERRKRLQEEGAL